MKARRLGGWFNTIVASLLLFGIWVMLSLVAARPGLKTLWDVTPQQTASVAPETEQLIAELRRREQVVEIHTFLWDYNRIAVNTDEEEHQRGLYIQVQQLTTDLLRRYAALGGATVRVIHHNEYLGLEDYRSAGNRFNLSRQDKNSVVVAVGDRFEKLSLNADLAEFSEGRAVPGAPRQQQLRQLKSFRGEAAISSAIKTLMLQGKPVVCFLVGYRHTGGLVGDPDGIGYTRLRAGLEKDGFEVRAIRLQGEGIPDDADLVVILEPTKEIPAGDAEVLAEWVRGGGRLLVNASYYPGDASRNPELTELGVRLGFRVARARLLHALANTTGGPRALDFGPRCAEIPVAADPSHPVTRPLREAGIAMRCINARPIVELDVMPRGVTAIPPILATGPLGYVVPLDSRGVTREAWRPMDATDPRTFRQLPLVQLFQVRPPDDLDADPGYCVLLAGGMFFNREWDQGRDFALNLFNYLAKRQERVTIRRDPYQARILKLEPRQVGNIRNLHFALVAVLAAVGGLLFFLRRRI